MKYLDEYRDPLLARALSERIGSLSRKPVRLMEICGTHTMAVFRHGIRSLLPGTIELLSGPGCPVCVTATEDMDRAAKLAGIQGVMVTTFGDMLRVPGSASSLQAEQAKGAQVRVVYSTLDALDLARKNPHQEVVFLGIGFETTAPTVAAAIQSAKQQGQTNFSVLSAHKLLPPAMEALLGGGDLRIDGFICPGHVSTIIGTSVYEHVIQRYGIPCVVTGFEPIDILQGILMLVEKIEGGTPGVAIQYTRGVTAQGNPVALKRMYEVFRPCDAPWRGLGLVPASGLAIREAYEAHDAQARFDLSVPPALEPPGCQCAAVLRGAMTPASCGLFRKACTPRTPVGPCMVSSEGACAAFYRYGG